MKFNEEDKVFISDGCYEGIIAEITHVGKSHYKAKILEDPNNKVGSSIQRSIIIDDKYLKPNIKDIPEPYESEEQLEKHSKQAEEYLEDQSATEKQIGGSHYKDFKIQPITFVLENEDHLHPTDAFLLNNVLKYLVRHRRKGGADDLDKAIHYIKLVKEHTYD